MSHGTILNDVYAIRMHRDTARDTVEDADRMFAHYRDTLLALVVSAPQPQPIEGMDDVKEPWHSFALREFNEAVEGLLEAEGTRWKAQYIIDNPELVIDDYDEYAAEQQGERG